VIEALLVSNLLLWGLVVALALVVVALTRQIGVLHERIAPAGALAVSGGAEVGESVPAAQHPGIGEEKIALGGADPKRRRTLLFFLSPTCPVCKELLPTLERIVVEHAPDLRLVYASDGEVEEHRAFRDAAGLGAHDYVLSRDLGLQFGVAKLPFAVLIDAQGVLRARGIVNTREHLESLFEAERLGVASVQEFLANGTAGGREQPAIGANRT
jgi:methylamine dehydrogenase accessory protein MauD